MEIVSSPRSTSVVAIGRLLAVALLCPFALDGARAQQPTADQELASTLLPDAPHPQTTSLEQVSAERVVGPPPSAENNPELKEAPKHLVTDEWQIITSPARASKHDLRWIIPVAALSAAAIATDSYTMQHVVSHNAGFNSTSDTVSGALRDTFIGVPAIIFGYGEMAHRSHAAETGLLAGQAMINAYATDEGIKYITLRERPSLNSARGHFWTSDSGSDPSFVSGHSIVAWSSAAVLAGEYTRPWQQVGIYTLATSVSFTRVLAYQHFPSDAALGAVSGWLIGRYILRAHLHSRQERDASSL